jgi:hypothetical protein
VTVAGRTLDRGFAGGLFRMRTTEPLPAEIAVTVDGDAPSLWLLDHGVLSARAVVPGYPAFSAAVEMSGVVRPGATTDELRSAANPYLPRLIDEATRMLLLLVERLPDVEEAVRARLTVLLLRCAERGLQRERMLAAPLVRVVDGGRSRFVSPGQLAAEAARRGGVLAAVEPNGLPHEPAGSFAVRATTEERGLLAALLGIRFELRAGEPVAGRMQQLAVRLRDLSLRVLGQIGPPPLDSSELSGDERHLVACAAGAGLRLGLSRGSGRIRRRGESWVVGRARAEVRAAVRACAADDAWIYPALLALTDDEPDDAPRRRWLDSVISSEL